MMYDTPPAFVVSLANPHRSLTTFRARKGAVMIATCTGHSFDNAQRRTASEKDRRETKETGKVRGIVLTRLFALD
jgi:hypothetical protein